MGEYTDGQGRVWVHSGMPVGMLGHMDRLGVLGRVFQVLGEVPEEVCSGGPSPFVGVEPVGVAAGVHPSMWWPEWWDSVDG